MTVKPVLSDKDKFPDKKLIFSLIGRNSKLWDAFFEIIHSGYPDFEENWKYYNDGKSWLMKVARKSKTIFWLSVIEGTFRATFYFTDKAEEHITRAKIPEPLKEKFFAGNKIRGITIVFKNKKDLDYAGELIRIKLSLK